MDEPSHSPPQKRAKPQTDINQPEATSSNPAEPDIAESDHSTQQPTKPNITTGLSLKDGILNFFLSSEEECHSTPEENLEPNSAGLKSSRTGGVWHRSLEESYSAQIKERTLLGHLVCSEEAQKKFLESDIFRILESEGVTEIGALYKVSLSKFILIFGSKTAKDKLQDTEIQWRFSDSEENLISANELNLSRVGRKLSSSLLIFLST